MKNLTETTSLIQRKNGTRAFLCIRTGAIYTSHKNGYIRRQRLDKMQYQLNPVIKVDTGCGFYKTKRVLILDEKRRLDIIHKRAMSYLN